MSHVYDGSDGSWVTKSDPWSTLIAGSYLCVDRHFNIIVSDWGAHNLKIFSMEGHLLTNIGQKGDGPGNFYRPHGIDVDKDGRIVVVDHKESHKLQFF